MAEFTLEQKQAIAIARARRRRAEAEAGEQAQTEGPGGGMSFFNKKRLRPSSFLVCSLKKYL